MGDRDAVLRLREGDIGGLEALVKEYQVSALRAAFIVSQDRALAEDVVAAAFLKAYDRIHQFDTRRPFGPWFLRIVVNDATKAVASRSRQVSLDQAFGKNEQSLGDILPDPGPSLEEIAEQADARYAIGAALAKLSPTQSKAIVMRYYLGLGEAEVAFRLGNTVGTVKRRLHMARMRLRTILGGPTRRESPGAGVVSTLAGRRRLRTEEGTEE